ncbi:hypothetical protein BGW38_005871, partial [Lunasporangiospora selenospora]
APIMKSIIILALFLQLACVCFAGDEYLFAHCVKEGRDWDYIQESYCTNFDAYSFACNGACFTKNARYCMYDDKRKLNLCKFKDWCEGDGQHTAVAKLCRYTASIPGGCTEDRVIQKYTYGDTTECTTLYTGE